MNNNLPDSVCDADSLLKFNLPDNIILYSSWEWPDGDRL